MVEARFHVFMKNRPLGRDDRTPYEWEKVSAEPMTRADLSDFGFPDKKTEYMDDDFRYRAVIAQE